MNKINQTITFIVILLCVLTANSIFQPVRASGPIYIRADGTVDPSGAPIQRNGDLYTLTANISSDVDGIIVEKSGITIDGNGKTVQGGVTGNAMYLFGVYNVTIRNTRTEGFRYGIYMDSASDNVIYGSSITGSAYDGLGLYESHDNIISSNNINESGWSGIGLYFSSGNNISANCMRNSYYGMNIYSSQDNSIFQNNFINNTIQVSTASSVSIWDNGQKGNYWSDYNGTDADGDYIGDTQYVIDQDNIDRYPLMYIYWNPADINHDLKVDIRDVSIAAKAFGTVPGDASWNPRADITGQIPLVPDGKVDIRDISLIAKNFGKNYQ